MPSRLPHTLRVLILSLACCLGCGGDGSFDSTTVPSEVTDLQVSARTIAVGEVANVEVSFTPEVFTPGDTSFDDESPSSSSGSFKLLIVLPRGLDYVDASSEQSDSFVGDVLLGNSDERGPNEVGICDDGSRFLLYRFSDDELSVDRPVATRIELKVQAYEAAGLGQVGATTDSVISIPCSEPLEAAVDVDVTI